ncbi:MAG: SDR family NAD(P)-dependent oxidoreductase [Armatimonadetes bacterium]|nr:SDR family NAD(P)-dependent oxidoreductase [Armatimonadota bacterium]
MNWNTAIVVGASSGIGEALTRLLAERGCKVAAIARREDRLEKLRAELPDRVITFVHDVHDTDAVPDLFQEATKQLGGLDLIIYAAGVMPDVGAHEYAFAKDREIVDVNLLGCIAWMNQAAIRFEGAKRGTMVALGSVAGDRGRSGQPVYNTSKAAVATYMEALRNRLARQGVTVVTVKPGPTASEMTDHLPASSLMPTRKAAEIILRKASRTGEHYLSFKHWLIFAIIKRIPSFIFRRLKL